MSLLFEVPLTRIYRYAMSTLFFFLRMVFFPPNSTGSVCAFVSFYLSNSHEHKHRAEMLPLFRKGVRGPPYQDSLK